MSALACPTPVLNAPFISPPPPRWPSMILSRRRPFDDADDRDPELFDPHRESVPADSPEPVIIRENPTNAIVVRPNTTAAGAKLPRLLIQFHKFIPPDRFEGIRCAVRHALEDGRPVVFEKGVDVYQFVEDRWAPLKPEA
jgi:hypothetical protein